MFYVHDTVGRHLYYLNLIPEEKEKDYNNSCIIIIIKATPACHTDQVKVRISTVQNNNDYSKCIIQYYL